MRFGKACAAALLFASMLVVLSGCDFGGEHEHTYTKWAVTKAASCVDNGVQSRQCEECGYMQTESLPAVGHTTAKDAAVKATCTEDGWTEGSHCSVCNQVLLAQQAIPAFGHAALVDYEIKATCMTDGLTEGSHCALCGVTIVEQEAVPATGHTYDDGTVVTPANCQQLGTKRFSCIFCDTSYLDTYSTTEHTVLIIAAVPPTCTQEGLTEGSRCRDCELVFAEQTAVPATGHLPVTDPAVEPDCVNEGKTEGTHCQYCEEVLTEQKVIPALGHQNEELVLLEATCQEPGMKQYTCTVCGVVSQDSYTLQPCGEKELYSAATAYVCEIVTYDKNGNVYHSGIGVVYSSDGRIVTSYRTITGACAAQVTVAGVVYAVQTVLAYDAQLDIAVLQIEAEGLTAAKICQVELVPGDTVYALSAPRSLNSTYTQGAVLSAGREIGGVVYLHHNAQVTETNDGGPLLNTYGEVIGINTYALSQQQSTNLALPVAQLELLDYTQPTTLLQIYEQNTSVFRQLADLILSNGTDDGMGYVIVYGSDTSLDSFYIYELGYCEADGRIYLKQYNKSNGGQQIDTLLYLQEDVTAAPYVGSFIINGTVYNQMMGSLELASYTGEEALDYDTSEGMKGYEATLQIRYRDNMNHMLEWMDSYMRLHLGMSASELGFTQYTF